MTIFNTHERNMIFEIPQVCSFFNAKKKKQNLKKKRKKYRNKQQKKIELLLQTINNKKQ